MLQLVQQTFLPGAASCETECKTEPNKRRLSRLHKNSVYNELQCAIGQANVASFGFWLYCS